jgi:hypothetical protein
LADFERIRADLYSIEGHWALRVWLFWLDKVFPQAYLDGLSRAQRRARQLLRSKMGGNPWNWDVPVLYLRLGEGQLFEAGEASPDLTLHVPDTDEVESPWLQPLDEADEAIPRSLAPSPDRQIIADQLTFYQGRVVQIEAQLEDAPAETRAQLEAELTDTRSKIDEYQHLLSS